MQGLATGIGSLPFKDAHEAVEFVFAHVPHIPFWPQLPKRDIREGMVAQFSEFFPCIRVSADGVFFDDRESEKELEAFYGRIIAGEAAHFKISPDYAAGLYAFYERLKKTDLKPVKYLKCHITGPFTFAASIHNKQGIALLHDEVFMQAILKGLAMKARWQIDLFKKFGKKIILFIDEPYLACFGSAFSPVSREHVVNGLRELTATLESEHVHIGVHCCGNTDWSMFCEVTAIDIISFDAFEFSDKLILYAHELKGFFKRGGILCWGIVPTQDSSEAITVRTLLKKLETGIKALVKKGVDADLVKKSLLVSPSCGLGTLDLAKAERIFGLLSEVSLAAQKL